MLVPMTVAAVLLVVAWATGAMEGRPLPFRPLNRRSGRIPAEPYPPFKFLQRRTKHSGVKAINPRGSGTESPRPAPACPSEQSRFRILPPGAAFPQRSDP